MARKIVCTHCGHSSRFKSELLHKKLRCPQCQSVFIAGQSHGNSPVVATPTSSLKLSLWLIGLMGTALMLVIGGGLWWPALPQPLPVRPTPEVQRLSSHADSPPEGPQSGLLDAHQLEAMSSGEEAPSVVSSEESSPAPQGSLFGVDGVAKRPVVGLDVQSALQASRAPAYDRLGHQLAELEAAIEVDAPAGYNVRVNNRDFSVNGSQRIELAQPGRVERRIVTARQGTAPPEKIDVLVRSGHVTRVSITPPDDGRPQLLVPVAGHSKPVNSLEFSPDGRLLLSHAGEVVLWDAEFGKPLWNLGDSDFAMFTATAESVITSSVELQVASTAWGSSGSAASRSVSGLSYARVTRLWSTVTGQPTAVRTEPFPQSERTQEAAVRAILLSSHLNEKPYQGEPLRSPSHGGILAWTTAGFQRVVLRPSDYRLQVEFLSTEKKKVAPVILEQQFKTDSYGQPTSTPTPIVCWSVSPQGGHLLAGYADGQLVQHDLRGGRSTRLIRRFGSAPERILFNAQGTFFATITQGAAAIWKYDATEGVPAEASPFSIVGRYSCVAFNREGTQIALGETILKQTYNLDKPEPIGGRVVVFALDALNGVPLLELKNLPAGPSCIAFHPSTGRIVAGLQDGRILLHQPAEKSSRLFAYILEPSPPEDRPPARSRRTSTPVEDPSAQIIRKRYTSSQADHDPGSCSGGCLCSQTASLHWTNGGFEVTRRFQSNLGAPAWLQVVQQGELGSPEYLLLNAESQTEKQQGKVASIAVSADGRQFATAVNNFNYTHQSAVFIRDSRSLEVRHVCEDPLVSSVAHLGVTYDASGRLVWLSLQQGGVRLSIWDQALGRLLHAVSCPLERSFPSCAAISRDAGRIVAACGDVAIVWDGTTGEEIARYPAATKSQPKIEHVAFSDDDQRVIVAEENIIRVWNLAEHLQDWKPFKGAPLQIDQIDDIQFSLNSNRLATSTTTGQVVLWDLNPGHPCFDLRIAPEKQSWQLSPDGRQILTTLPVGSTYAGDRGYQFKVWSADFRGQLLGVLGGQPGFSADGRRLLLRSGEVYDVASGQILPAVNMAELLQQAGVFDTAWRSTAGHRPEILWAQSLGTGLLAAVADSGTVRPEIIVLDLESQSVVSRLSYQTALDAKKGSPKALAISPDGRYVASGHYSMVVVYDIQTGEQLPLENVRATQGRNIPQFGRIDWLQFSGDSQRLLARSETRSYGNEQNPISAAVWSIPQGRALLTVDEGEKSGKVNAAISLDGRWALLGRTGADGRPAGSVLWDLAEGSLIREYPAAAATTLSPDGRHVLLVDSSGGLEFHDILSGQVVGRLILIREGWLFYTPAGHFDGSLQARQQIAYRQQGGAVTGKLDDFLGEYFYPGLLSAICRGERPGSSGDSPGQAPLLRMLTEISPSRSHESELQLDVAVTDQGSGAMPPWLMHNGQRIDLPERIAKHDETEIWRFRVHLTPGENRLSAHATAADSVTQAIPAVTNFLYESGLAPPELYVLAVGIDQYGAGSGISNLDYCVSDARAISELFLERTNGLYERVHVIELLNERATRLEILNALGQLGLRARPQDTLVMYVASHGLTIGQRFYLLPRDFRLPVGINEPSTEVQDEVMEGVLVRGQAEDQRMASVRRQGLAIDQLAEQLGRVPALRRVLIFDTCQSGGAAQLAGSRSNPLGVRNTSVQGVYVLAATSTSELAAESRELQHSLLTYALLQAASNPDDSKINVVQWFRQAAEITPGLYQRYIGREQHVEILAPEPGFPLFNSTSSSTSDSQKR